MVCLSIWGVTPGSRQEHDTGAGDTLSSYGSSFPFCIREHDDDSVSEVYSSVWSETKRLRRFLDRNFRNPNLVLTSHTKSVILSDKVKSSAIGG